MVGTDYKNSMAVNSTPGVVFSALTTGIPAWWSEDYSGAATKVNDEFTVRFKGKNAISMRIVEIVPNRKITWECVDFFIDVTPELHDKKEWIGTKVFWEIGDGRLEMKHEGLTPAFECYKFCEAGWTQFLGSLQQMLNGGAAMPHKAA